MERTSPIATEVESLRIKIRDLRETIRAAEEEHIPGPETQTLIAEWKRELDLIERQISDLEKRTGS
jgi:hypothetical protein